jgi:MFS family permease
MPARLFYAFTGLHSFLIGLFPFYIPVYLYTIGLTLSRICLFVAATGIGYCLTLFLWDRVCRRISFSILIVWSFCSEYLLLSLFFFENQLSSVVLAGLVNGVFNCSFWTIQRLLFVKTISPENSGRNFGNSQLFVLVVLKAGILLGGYFLEQWGFLIIYLSSGLIVLLSAAIFSSRVMTAHTSKTVKLTEPLEISAVFRFKDEAHSRWVFVIDGVFLYLESYFWVISLFIIVRESFLRLGLIVIMLAVFFGVIFLFIKNSIDRLPGQKVYVAAVALYALSWGLRGFLGENHDPVTMLLLLALITLCTSVFRLSFNKRFFDNAKLTTAHEYIFIKSYISQFSLAVCFLVMAGGFSIPGSVAEQLSGVYYFAAIASFFYLIYRITCPEGKMRLTDAA